MIWDKKCSYRSKGKVIIFLILEQINLMFGEQKISDKILNYIIIILVYMKASKQVLFWFV